MQPDLDWNQFISDYSQSVFLFCLQFLGSKSEAEDVMQDTFLKAYKNRYDLKNNQAIKGWIYSIARNCCIDRKRWWKIRVHESFSEELTPVENKDIESIMVIRKEVTLLPVKQKEVFILRHWHGFSTTETAQILKLDEGTVKTHLKRAVDKIKQKLKE